jgi:hypothetical protein
VLGFDAGLSVAFRGALRRVVVCIDLLLTASIGVEVMHSIGRDVLDGIDRLDAQILAASKR